MFCQNCGKEISDASAFCPYCGEKTVPAVGPAAPANKTQAFIAQKNAANGVAPTPAPVNESGNKTEAFLAAKQQQAAAPAPQPQAPVQPPYGGQAPVQQPPYAAPYAPPAPQKKKGFPAWAIVLIVVGALFIAGTVGAVIIGHRIKKSIEDYSSEVQSEFEDLFDTTGSYIDEESGIDLSDVGRPEESDFSWFNGIPQDFPSGSTRLTAGEEINGKWKAYYDMGEVKELVNIELEAGDRAVTVTIDPYMINYSGLEWEYESYAEKYSYDGALDEGTITAHSDKLGTIHLYGFYELNGKQYAFGDTMLQSGETVTIAMVRP